jgi:CubicO group peptidase (beta-lactamase class C family)
MAGCSASERHAEIEAAPPVLTDGWRVAAPAEAGFEPGALAALTADLDAGAYPNTHAVLIEHDGRLVFEEYFEGDDEFWGEPVGHVAFDRDSRHDLRSISKSVTAAVLGIALGDGFEAALDRPVLSFFSDNPRIRPSPGAEAVTLRHALTMTAGLEWNEMTVPYTDPDNDELQLYAASDPVALVLSRPVREPAGQRWYYSGGLTQVIAGVIEEVTGRPLGSYADEVLFRPLGITDYEWLEWGEWDRPAPRAASGVRLRARDLAKFGSLFLHGGRWGERQIVPASWVEESSRRHVPEAGEWSGDGVYGYALHWWHGRFGVPDARFEAVTGRGNGGQRVFVIPTHDLVITVFAGNYNTATDGGERIAERVVAAHDPTRGAR